MLAGSSAHTPPRLYGDFALRSALHCCSGQQESSFSRDARGCPRKTRGLRMQRQMHEAQATSLGIAPCALPYPLPPCASPFHRAHHFPFFSGLAQGRLGKFKGSGCPLRAPCQGCRAGGGERYVPGRWRPCGMQRGRGGFEGVGSARIAWCCGSASTLAQPLNRS